MSPQSNGQARNGLAADSLAVRAIRILQAVPGSRHGYDVVDHSQISADLKAPLDNF